MSSETFTSLPAVTQVAIILGCVIVVSLFMWLVFRD
jgi:hypothetical protein